jgi:hypothetical protein
MTEQQLQRRLLRLARRASGPLMLNRMLSFVLVNAVLYILLLLLVMLADLPLLLLNLLFFASLALFPLYLLTPLPIDRLRLSIRRLDKHCLLESYLAAGRPELRRYMLPGLQRLLAAMFRQRITPLRLSRLNGLLFAALLACLAGYQAGMFLRFDSFTWSFSAQELKARSLRPADAAEGAAAPSAAPGLESPGEEVPLSEEGESAAARRQAEPALDLTGLPEGGTEVRGGLRQAGEDADAGGGEAPRGSDLRRPADPAAREAPAGGGDGKESDEEGSGESGRGLQQAGSAGRGFLESPLTEYQAALRELAARGGSELTAGSLLEAVETGAYPPGLFRDYTGGGLAPPLLDPMLARIRADYLRLLYERFRP